LRSFAPTRRENVQTDLRGWLSPQELALLRLKRCAYCKMKLPLIDFPLVGGARRSYCSICEGHRRRELRARRDRRMRLR
jgi:hypothetical protein